MSRYKTKAEERADYLGYQRGYHAGVKKSVKHGRWMSTFTHYLCSECRNGWEFRDTPKHFFEFTTCPFCGARMDLSREDLMKRLGLDEVEECSN